MTEIWAQAALWLTLALLASLLSIWFRVATALSEIVVGTIAQLIICASAYPVLETAGELQSTRLKAPASQEIANGDIVASRPEK